MNFRRAAPVFGLTRSPACSPAAPGLARCRRTATSSSSRPRASPGPCAPRCCWWRHDGRAFYDSQEIIYSRRPGERAYYQLSS